LKADAVLKFDPIIPSDFVKFVNLFFATSKSEIPELVPSHRLPSSSSRIPFIELSANPSFIEYLIISTLNRDFSDTFAELLITNLFKPLFVPIHKIV